MRFLLTLFLTVIYSFAFAQEDSYYQWVPNEGQWPEEVVAKVELENGSIWARKDGWRYNFIDYSEIQNLHTNPKFSEIVANQTPTIKGHVYDVKFLNAHSTTPNFHQKQKHYFNYFLGDDPTKWAGNVSAFAGMKYNNLYTNIDLHSYSSDFVMKYDFIVKPGGDPSDIQLQYEGQDRVKIKDGRVIISTSVNQVIEQKPLAWQIIDGKKKLVPCKYSLKKDVLGFEFEKGFDPNYELIIDPVLIFSTYSGSTADNFGYTATFDDEGYLYSGSSAFGNGYPFEVGSYQETWGGGDGQGTLPGTDIAITKYDVTGTFRVYSTYLGGENDELPHSLIVNSAGELIVMGSSSSTNFPTTSDVIGPDFEGGIDFAPIGVGVDYVNGSDIILAKFNSEGSNLLSSTYLGGSDNDGTNTAPNLKFNYADEFRGEVEIDNDGNVYVVSCTYSSNYPVENAHQNNNGGGLDGVITKLNDDFSDILWSSYFGGADNDGVYALAVASDNSVFVCGGTESENFDTTSGVLNENALGGQADGFVAHFGENGDLVSSTYFGSAFYDQSYFIELDGFDQVHIYGQTLAPDNTFIFNAAYSEPNSGMVVAKIENDLSALIWSTVFGTGEGEPNLSPTAFLVDVCGKIYLSGWGGTTNTSSNPNTDTVTGMVTTSDAYQSTTNGSDFYLMVIEDDASDLVYASFFGGGTSNEHVDGGTSRFNRKGEIYQSVCAGCGGNDDFPIFPSNAVSPTNNSSNCNNGVFKFDFQLPITVSDFYVPPLGCVNVPIQFFNNSAGGQSFEWHFGDGETSDEVNPIHIYDEPGIFEVTLYSFNSLTCNMEDSLTKTIEILEPQSTDLGDFEICVGESIELGPVEEDASFTYIWTPSTYLDASNVPEPTSSPEDDINYTLLIDNGACIDTVYQNIEVNIIDLEIPGDTVLCDDSELLFMNAESTSIDPEFIWSYDSDFGTMINDDLTDSDINIEVTNPVTVYIQIQAEGCTLDSSVFVNFLSAQTQISGAVNPCAGDTVTLYVDNPSEDIDYTWFPNDVIISGQGTDEIQVILFENTEVILEAVIDEDCTASDSVILTVSDLAGEVIDAEAEPEVITGGDSSQLNVSPSGFDYVWTPAGSLDDANSENPTATPDETTWYYVSVSEGECTFIDSVEVRVFDFICGDPSIYVPNAFTPNSDNQNELLYVRGNFITRLYFVIYDRWGEKIFETTNIDIGWDGTYKGKEVDPAVFVYYLEAVCADGQEYFEEGNITVIR